MVYLHIGSFGLKLKTKTFQRLSPSFMQFAALIMYTYWREEIYVRKNMSNMKTIINVFFGALNYENGVHL